MRMPVFSRTALAAFWYLVVPEVLLADMQLLYPDNQVLSKPIVEFRARQGGVGHAFLFLGREIDNGNAVFYGVAGFYPEHGSNFQTVKNVLYGPGVVTYKFDDLRLDRSFRVYINEEQEIAVRALITGWDAKQYSIGWQNCTHLVREAAVSLNLTATDFSVDTVLPYDVVDRLATHNNANRPIEIAARDATFIKSGNKLDAIVDGNDEALKHSLEQNRKSELYLKAIDVLAAKQSDEELKSRIIDQRNNILKLYDRVREIETALRLALALAQKAADFQDRLKVALTAVQIASLAMQAKDLFPGSGITGTEDLVTLQTRVKEYKAEMDGYILRYRTQLDLQKRLTKEEMTRLKPILNQSGGSGSDLDWTP